MKHKRGTEFGDWFHEGDPVATHERLGNAWWAWMMWVFVLEDSADFIWERSAYEKGPAGEIRMPMTLCVHAMLVGYAIECALKGLWVRKGNKLVNRGRYVGVPGGRDHDLVHLASEAGFAVSGKESDILRRLSRFVQFAGRYPVAKTPDKMLPYEDAALGKVDVGHFSPQDFRIASSIINKIVRNISGKKRRGFPRRRLRARFLEPQR